MARNIQEGLRVDSGKPGQEWGIGLHNNEHALLGCSTAIQGAELEETRSAFHALLAQVPDDAWESSTNNPFWNNRQLLYHIVMAVEMFPQDIKLIRRQRLISPPAWLFNWLNIYSTRWRARRHNRASLAAAYDSAHDIVLTILDGIKEEEWNLSGRYPDLGGNMPGGHRTIEMMFHYLSQHFQDHAQ